VIASATQVAGGGELCRGCGCFGCSRAGFQKLTRCFQFPCCFHGASAHYPHSFSLPRFCSRGHHFSFEYNGAYPALKKFSALKKCPAAGKMVFWPALVPNSLRLRVNGRIVFNPGLFVTGVMH